VWVAHTQRTPNCSVIRVCQILVLVALRLVFEQTASFCLESTQTPSLDLHRLVWVLVQSDTERCSQRVLKDTHLSYVIHTSHCPYNSHCWYTFGIVKLSNHFLQSTEWQILVVCEKQGVFWLHHASAFLDAFLRISVAIVGSVSALLLQEFRKTNVGMFVLG